MLQKILNGYPFSELLQITFNSVITLIVFLKIHFKWALAWQLNWTVQINLKKINIRQLYGTDTLCNHSVNSTHSKTSIFLQPVPTRHFKQDYLQEKTHLRFDHVVDNVFEMLFVSVLIQTQLWSTTSKRSRTLTVITQISAWRFGMACATGIWQCSGGFTTISTPMPLSERTLSGTSMYIWPFSCISTAL